MINEDLLIQLSNRSSVIALNDTQKEIANLNLSESEILDLTNEMFRIGSKSHLFSLNPILREELGFQLEFMTQGNSELRQRYKDKKNKYLSIGKSFASISFLFDLVGEDFTALDILLMHELLMDDGQFRTNDVFVLNSEGEKKVFSREGISGRIDDLMSWYYSLKTNPNVSEVILATVFHYYILLIHPFMDGNGRISRLFLNLILLKKSLFPIVIPYEKRKDYYTALNVADNNKFDLLIDLVAALAKQRLEEYLKLTKGLANLDNSVECLVLTEDGNTTMIQSLLSFHGFDMKKTSIESYDGKDNIASAVFLAKKMINKKPNLRYIVLHRDRDNDSPQQLEQIITKLVKNAGLQDITTVFVTRFYDMESYFLNECHVNEVFPSIPVQRAKELIELATKETSEGSKKKLRIAYFDYGKYGKIEDPQERAIQINALYDSDPIKYRYGKNVLYKLEELITTELGQTEKVSLVKQGKHIKVQQLESARNKLQN